MRRPERIPIVLKNIDFQKFVIDLQIFDNEEETNALIDWHIHKEKILIFWTQNPDLRLTQVLVNLGLLPNSVGFWYHKEETDYLVEKNILNFEDIHFWGVNYNKKGKKLPKTKYVLLKDLEIEHIINIVAFFEKNSNVSNINKKYLNYFTERIIKEDKTEELNTILLKSINN